ncbi:MAG: tetratricopeptide repeat protein [bacterium]
MLRGNVAILLVHFILITILLCSGCVALPHKPPPKTTEEVARALEQENFDIAMAYYKAGMLEEALHFFKETLKLNPQHTQAKQFRDKILVELKKEEPVPTKPEIIEEKKLPELPSLKEVGSPTIKEIPPLKEKEPVVEVEELPKPKEVKKEVEKKPPSLPEAPFFEFAKDLRTQKLYSDAITELSNILRDYPDTKLKDKIDFELANTYFDTGQYDKALKGFEEIMAKKNDFVHDVHLMIAKCYEKRGDLEKARLEYLRLIKLLSIPPPPKIEEAGTESIGLKQLIKQITPLPQKKEELEAQAHLGAGNVCRTKKEYRQAIVEYDQVIKKCPKSSVSPEAAFYIADIYDRVPELRDYERAVDSYTKVITDYPDSKWVDRAKERKKYLLDNYL